MCLLALAGYNNYMTKLYFEIFFSMFSSPCISTFLPSLLNSRMFCAHCSGKYMTKQKTEEPKIFIENLSS